MLCDEHREKIIQDGWQKQSIDEKFTKNRSSMELSIAQMFL